MQETDEISPGLPRGTTQLTQWFPPELAEEYFASDEIQAAIELPLCMGSNNRPFVEPGFGRHYQQSFVKPKAITRTSTHGSSTWVGPCSWY